MDAVEYYFRTASLWIVLALPIVFAVLTFIISASYFRFISAAVFAIAAYWLFTEPDTAYGQVYVWIAVLYMGLAIAMPFAKIASRQEDAADKDVPPINSLDRFVARSEAYRDRVRRLNSIGVRTTIRKNPYAD